MKQSLENKILLTHGNISCHSRESGNPSASFQVSLFNKEALREILL
jgi:hypothetical protein